MTLGEHMASATEQKAETEIDLLRAIRTDIAGLRAELNDIKAQVMNGHALPPQAPKLSQRQHAILERLCRGESNKVIGRTLNLPESTVKVHVRELMRKLSVDNRTQVAIVAARLRLTGPLKNDRPIIGGYG
jgi:DNA-binding NarL/FixJ family response regulator